ncbi:ImmA/IrrE family metallo-endopeptidase [Bacteroides thetaiotaomicron]|jgi:hypothetical protein|nr:MULTISPECIES: ImmA/IrrE family metallo-endopeptidase [unclassified Pseudoflavonifractor]KAB4605724.1 ImmA/IrrE family metallo-endopeptidase [Bacteroides thetaiotaomicron]MTQ98836.1 ImmA/IrrE family metallo-endopeptidase [Pseudoflavonifractor sp. BIOML-A16]MTR08091.1 ImmA/IrrE family metallo-endopeptidase [Pseudoflavonifractor sp. BIOML-A15]MTR33955.1 ImmA/IrrE family metallo-endopeptidase [Pseudoflavonifractor sp. BIOML-A14]MTR37994.1 ImmA/IrrE family metallo-endopeptidase [Pseudoflavonifra
MDGGMNDVPNNLGVKLAYPRTRDSIRRDTYLLRAKLGLADTPYFPILHFLENVLPLTDESFYLEVLDDDLMAGIQAEYVPHINAIKVRRSVYDAAVEGHWWARSTLAHELGHYYYHDEKSVRYAKLDPFESVPPDFDPERQANIFSAELLAPINLIEGKSREQIGRECGVSHAVAKNQIFALDRIRRRQDRKRIEKKKRSGKKPNR